MSSRSTWQSAGLAEQLEITERSVRRDITRLRDLGYPVHSVSGRYGGYSLGAGGRLPPLLLDDDEAVSIAVALHDVSQRSEQLVAQSALSALTKLGQVLPASLRDRVAALSTVVVGVPRPNDPSPSSSNVDVLMTIALACSRSERLRFDYQTAGGVESSRSVEPYRLVSVGRRWYLVAFDLDRVDWRTFRVDRIDRTRNNGARFVRVEEPDAAALVAQGLAVGAHENIATIRVARPLEITASEINPTTGIATADPDDPAYTLVEIGGDLDWLARFLAGFPLPYEVIEPPELRDELRRLGEVLVAANSGEHRAAGTD